MHLYLYIYIYIYTHIHNFSRSYTIYNGHDRVNVCPFVLHARMNEWIMHLYSTLLCIVVHPKRFTIMWGVSPQPPPSVQHPLGWCDGCHRTTAPVRSPHTSYRWRGERVIEPIKCMRSPHTSYRWRGERVIEPIKCMLSPHTSYRWRGERVMEPIKCMHSPHTSYRWRGESHRTNQVDGND